MQIIVHYPKTEQEINALQEKVALVHAESISRYIEKMSYSKEEKVKLLNYIQESLILLL